MATSPKRRLKYKSISFVLLRNYFNSFKLFRNGELVRNQIGRGGVQVKKENKKFTVLCVHVLHKTLNLVISRCCFAEDDKEVYQNFKRTCRTIVFLIKPFVLWRCRCCRRRR